MQLRVCSHDAHSFNFGELKIIVSLAYECPLSLRKIVWRKRAFLYRIFVVAFHGGGWLGVKGALLAPSGYTSWGFLPEQPGKPSYFNVCAGKNRSCGAECISRHFLKALCPLLRPVLPAGKQPWLRLEFSSLRRECSRHFAAGSER